MLAGAQAQVQAMGLKMGGTTGHKPTDTDFNAAVAKLRDANCDLIVLGTIVKDTVIILQTAHKIGWNPISWATLPPIRLPLRRRRVARQKGSIRCRRRRTATQMTHVQRRTYLRRSSSRLSASIRIISGRQATRRQRFSVAALEKAGRDLTLDSFIAGMESMKDWHDVFDGPPLSLSSTNHHASNQSFLSVVKDTRWPRAQEPLSF